MTTIFNRNLGFTCYLMRVYIQELLKLQAKENCNEWFLTQVCNLFRIYMEQNLINDDLIRKLCAIHDEALSLKKDSSSSEADKKDSSGTSQTKWFTDLILDGTCYI